MAFVRSILHPFLWTLQKRERERDFNLKGKGNSPNFIPLLLPLKQRNIRRRTDQKRLDFLSQTAFTVKCAFSRQIFPPPLSPSAVNVPAITMLFAIPSSSSIFFGRGGGEIPIFPSPPPSPPNTRIRRRRKSTDSPPLPLFPQPILPSRLLLVRASEDRGLAAPPPRCFLSPLPPIHFRPKKGGKGGISFPFPRLFSLGRSSGTPLSPTSPPAVARLKKAILLLPLCI